MRNNLGRAKLKEKESPYLHISVQPLDGGAQVFFKLKRRTRLEKLMYSYCNRKSVQMYDTRFFYDGCLVRVEQTPHELRMESGAIIFAMPH